MAAAGQTSQLQVCQRPLSVWNKRQSLGRRLTKRRAAQHFIGGWMLWEDATLSSLEAGYDGLHVCCSKGPVSANVLQYNN